MNTLLVIASVFGFVLIMLLALFATTSILMGKAMRDDIAWLEYGEDEDI
jgi:hypothetical protein